MPKDRYVGTRAPSWTPLHHESSPPVSREKGSCSKRRIRFFDEYFHARLYFATDQKVRQGPLVQLHLKMPKEIVGDEVQIWSFTGRVAHVESLNRQNGKSGVGVQFLFYEVPRPLIK